MPKIVIKEFEVDANPPLIDEGTWSVVVKTLKQIINNRETRRGPVNYLVKGRIRTMELIQRGDRIDRNCLCKRY